MISATDWVNSSPPRGKIIKYCFIMVNISVHLQRTEVRCYQKPEVIYLKFFNLCYSSFVPVSILVHGSSLVQTPLHPCRGYVEDTGIYDEILYPLLCRHIQTHTSTLFSPPTQYTAVEHTVVLTTPLRLGSCRHERLSNDSLIFFLDILSSSLSSHNFCCRFPFLLYIRSYCIRDSNVSNKRHLTWLIDNLIDLVDTCRIRNAKVVFLNLICKEVHTLVELDQVQVKKIVGFVCLGGIKLAYLQVNTSDVHDFVCLALALHVRQYLWVRD